MSVSRYHKDNRRTTSARFLLPLLPRRHHELGNGLHRRVLDGAGWTQELSFGTQLVLVRNDGLSELLSDGKAEDLFRGGTRQKLPTDTLFPTAGRRHVNR